MRCQGYNDKGKKCHTRIASDKLYCCEKHKPKNLDEIMEECTICCLDLKNEDIKVLKCGHAHHRSCLNSWMDKCPYGKQNCPYCRAPIRWDRNNLALPKVCKNNANLIFDVNMMSEEMILN